MRKWEVVLEWGNGESTHVIAIGNTSQEAHKHATKNLPSSALDNLSSVEVLDEIDNSNQAKEIVALMKRLLECGYDKLSFDTSYADLGGQFENAPTVRELLEQLIDSDRTFKNCKDW